ncbi:MAG: hypothetical protein ETSY2_27755 [Candidatus Entotheonella gemina]|uniref:Uncharacterized protein n=1 Tax=Candidatus Entotheonella gemina TaxID=1429439 RepID=W4M3S5_9BACT|nr:MAG: hypothetical protein ETSY2_27755 [Candidatus Entotheonella gemina]
METRLFTKEELAEMEKRTVDRLTEAIEAGDTEVAKRIAQRMYNEFESMHDLYRDWTTATLSYIGRNFGNDTLEAALTEGVRAWWLPNLDKLPTGADAMRQRIKMFVAGLHGHLQPLHIEEDDDKVVIQMQPCGSGGRLVLEGKYEGPDAFLTLDTPQKLTYGRDNFPVYCAHEPPMEWLDIEQNGAPFMVVEPSRDIGREPCSFIIYKDPTKVPAKYYERLGLSKPENLPNKPT